MTEEGGVRLDPDFRIAGGPVSLRAEAVMVGAARLLASARVSFVVESSVLSHKLLDALVAGGARVLAVHVVAVDTSCHGDPDIEPVEAVIALIR